MGKKENLANKIANKLERLSKLLTKIDEIHVVNSDDPETWDSDSLYNLVENLKETLKLLEDKKDPKNRDPWGEPLILEEGLCSLVDEYHEDKESNSDD